MNKKLNKTRNIIILSILILIVMIIVCLMFISKDNSNNEMNIVQKEESDVNLTEIMDINEVYNTEKCINNYLKDMEDENNLAKNIKLENNEKLYMKKLYVIEANQKNTIYFVYANIINVQKKKKEEIKLTLVVDNENDTFDISVYGNKYNNIINYKEKFNQITFDKQKIKQINETIDYKGYNNFYFSNINNEELATRFYEEFKINILYFPKDLYNMMDEEYRKERFSTYNSFENYLKKYSTIIEENTLSKYSVNKTEKYTEFTLLDTHQNNFIIKTKESPMEYIVFLDYYTIKTKGYEKRYASANDVNKVSTNIKMFMSMINTADYIHAYRLLDETFKEKNFKTEALFETYIKNNFFEYNIINIENIKENGSYYISQIKLKNNNSRASEKKELTIIMKLLEGTDFVMSFNIK